MWWELNQLKMAKVYYLCVVLLVLLSTCRGKKPRNTFPFKCVCVLQESHWSNLKIYLVDFLNSAPISLSFNQSSPLMLRKISNRIYWVKSRTEWPRLINWKLRSIRFKTLWFWTWIQKSKSTPIDTIVGVCETLVRISSTQSIVVSLNSINRIANSNGRKEAYLLLTCTMSWQELKLNNLFTLLLFSFRWWWWWWPNTQPWHRCAFHHHKGILPISFPSFQTACLVWKSRSNVRCLWIVWKKHQSHLFWTKFCQLLLVTVCFACLPKTF